MTGGLFLQLALGATFAMLAAAFVLVVVRIARGPSLADRILGLDLLVMVAVGTIAAFAIRSGYALYVDIAIALGLVGFLSTVALARYVLIRGDVREEGDG